ncbi:hypothetical protein [Halorubrum aquaticum]|nr:hypothetical protein [Halorubrum aquaticum]
MTTLNESDYYAADWMGFEWSPWRSPNPAAGELRSDHRRLQAVEQAH